MKALKTGTLFLALSILAACGGQSANATDLDVGFTDSGNLDVADVGEGVDGAAPVITSTTPANGATAVAFNAPITATFSEAMGPLTIATAFTLKKGETVVPGTATCADGTAIFTPTAPLEPTTL